MLEQYTKEVVLAKEAPPQAIIARIDTRLAHCGLGLSTEYLELLQSTSASNTLEELGDLLWYLMLTASTLQIPPNSLITRQAYDRNSNNLSLEELGKSVEEFASLIKKHIIYKKPQDDKLRTTFFEMWSLFLIHCAACNTSLPFLLAANKLKLGIRYKEGFTADESEQRKDKQEGQNGQTN